MGEVENDRKNILCFQIFLQRRKVKADLSGASKRFAITLQKYTKSIFGANISARLK